MNESARVKDLQKEVCKKTGVRTKDCYLVCKSRALNDEQARLSEVGAEENATIEQVGRLPGGAPNEEPNLARDLCICMSAPFRWCFCRW